MSLSVFHPVIYADRVCFHKWAFTTARTISFDAGCSGNTALYFSRSNASMVVKYNRLAIHHALIRRIVLLSQGTPSLLVLCSDLEYTTLFLFVAVLSFAAH